MPYSDKQIGIMESAEALFAERGFAGTSVRDIADKADVNLAMISYYFGSKEKLLESLFAWRSESNKLILEEIVGKPDLSALDKVNLLVDHYIEKILLQQNFQKVLAREQVNSSTGPVAELIINMKKQNLGIISRLINEGQQKGEFRLDIDIPLMMITMVGTVNQLVTTKQHYCVLSGMGSMSEQAFRSSIHEKLSRHFKSLFKMMLGHEV
ncbi:MAG: TetR family transcriptional regulator [Ferruginibacter sp.]|jgi:AcrR family transcriptional regulator